VPALVRLGIQVSRAPPLPGVCRLVVKGVRVIPLSIALSDKVLFCGEAAVGVLARRALAAAVWVSNRTTEGSLARTPAANEMPVCATTFVIRNPYVPVRLSVSLPTVIV